MPRFPGFVAGSAPSQSALATSERTLNFYVEKIGTQGPQNKMALYPTPGQQAWITAASSGGVLTDVGGRGGVVAGTRAFVVIGLGFYEVFADATISKRGSVAQDGNVAQLAYNGATGGQVLIASGSNAYLFVLSTNTLTTVLTGEANQIGMLDEYFLALNQATGKLRLSNLNDGSVWDPTQFALRSAQPEPWAAMIVNAPDIWLLGSNSGDVWYDAGTSPFPLAARTGLNIPYGAGANFSLTATGGQLFWLAQNKDGAGVVVNAQGYGAEAVSSLELDTAISTYARTASITDAEGFTYQQEGHTFYVLHFPSANATWVYDLTTQIWHERSTRNATTGVDGVWRARFHLYAFGKHLVGNAATGTVSILDVTYGTEADGAAIRRLRRSPVLIQEMKRLSIHRLELVLEAGLGTVAGQGLNPKVMARFSKDGGKTWSNERSCGSGAIGHYLQRVFWTRLGSPRLFVAEIVMSDPVPWRVIDALVNNDADVAAA